VERALKLYYTNPLSQGWAMIITVDSNVLLSIFTKDTLYDPSSMLMEKYSSHEYIINDCIYLELTVHFPEAANLDETLDILEVSLICRPRACLYIDGR